MSDKATPALSENTGAHSAGGGGGDKERGAEGSAGQECGPPRSPKGRAGATREIS